MIDKLRGTLVLTIIFLNTLLHAPILFLITLFRLIPGKAWRAMCTQSASAVATNWISVNSALLQLTESHTWNVEYCGDLSPKQWYLVTANHQSWADILIAQRVLNKRTPFLKFFLKQELIWVPVIGLCWWALDFPFMKRYSKDFLNKNPHRKGKDLEATKKACEKFKYAPTAVFNFMEGTRLTPIKHEQTNSPYEHLLKPKAGGVGFVLGAMGEMIPTIIDITIYYPKGIPTFWEFLCGKAGAIQVKIESKDIPAELRNGNYLVDDEYRRGIQMWVNELWEAKDKTMKELRERT